MSVKKLRMMSADWLASTEANDPLAEMMAREQFIEELLDSWDAINHALAVAEQVTRHITADNLDDLKSALTEVEALP